MTGPKTFNDNMFLIESPEEANAALQNSSNAYSYAEIGEQGESGESDESGESEESEESGDSGDSDESDKSEERFKSPKLDSLALDVTDSMPKEELLTDGLDEEDYSPQYGQKNSSPLEDFDTDLKTDTADPVEESTDFETQVDKEESKHSDTNKNTAAGAALPKSEEGLLQKEESAAAGYDSPNKSPAPSLGSMFEQQMLMRQ